MTKQETLQFAMDLISKIDSDFIARGNPALFSGSELADDIRTFAEQYEEEK